MNIREWLSGYYLATPLFVLIDFVFGANVRAAGFEGHPVLKYAYYSVCFGCFLLMRRRPSWAPAISLSESVLNLGVLVVSFLGPFYVWMGHAGEGAMTPSPVTMERVISFIFSGSTACVAYYSNEGVARPSI